MAEAGPKRCGGSARNKDRQVTWDHTGWCVTGMCHLGCSTLKSNIWSSPCLGSYRSPVNGQFQPHFQTQIREKVPHDDPIKTSILKGRIPLIFQKPSHAFLGPGLQFSLSQDHAFALVTWLHDRKTPWLGILGLWCWTLFRSHSTIQLCWMRCNFKRFRMF